MLWSNSIEQPFWGALKLIAQQHVLEKTINVKEHYQEVTLDLPDVTE